MSGAETPLGTYQHMETLMKEMPGFLSPLERLASPLRNREFLTDPKQHTGSRLLNASWHPTISSSEVHFSRPQPFPALRFSNEPVFHIRWPKYWSLSFNISPLNEHSGLISFRMDCITISKPSGGNGIPAELFKILKDAAAKLLHSICQ